MKRKIIIANTFIILFSLVIFFVISSLIIVNQNKEETKKELESYLHIASNIFDGDNYAEVYDAIKVKNLRLTFILKDGSVIYDSQAIDSSLDNHLDREEIKNLNTISIRYSKTLDQRMYYIATLSKDTFIRVSIPEHSIKEYLDSYIISTSISFFAILLVSSVCLVYLLNNGFKPLNQQVNKISKIVGKEENYIGDDVEVLSDRINEVNNLINQKIYQIEFESRKLKTILDNLTDVVLIISTDGVILNCNKKAYEILENNDLINKKIDYIVNNKEFVDVLNVIINDSDNEIREINLKNKIYLSYCYRFCYLYDNCDAIMVSLTDVTLMKDLEKAKREFFANSSHELKSPLTSILGYQQMIQSGIITEHDEISDATNKTIQEALRMKKLIEEMLELSRLEAKVEKAKENINIKDMVNSILKHYTLDIKDKNLSIVTEISNDEIYASKYDLEILIKNIIENSIKYNKVNGKILIKYDSSLLTIKDTGIGIEDKHIDKVFERFYRVDKNQSKQNGGTGLGLAIVKHICLNNGYSYKIESSYLVETKVTIDFNNGK